MIIYELSIRVYLMSDINVIDVRKQISNLIDGTLVKDEQFFGFHKENKFKNYVYDGLFHVEPSGIYKEGGIYTFRIRTVDKVLAEYLEKNLFTAYTEQIKVLTVSRRIIPKRFIEKIFAITPCVIKSDEGYWKTHISVEDYEKRITQNLMKNFNEFYQTKCEEEFDFFTRIEFHNKVPIAIPFKNNITLLGDKVTLHICENDMAQKLSYFALGVGVGECGSRGCGFTGYKYL